MTRRTACGLHYGWYVNSRGGVMPREWFSDVAGLRFLSFRVRMKRPTHR